jgi:hypothetical protein
LITLTIHHKTTYRFRQPATMAPSYRRRDVNPWFDINGVALDETGDELRFASVCSAGRGHLRLALTASGNASVESSHLAFSRATGTSSQVL